MAEKNKMAKNASELALQVVLAEFAALRDEIKDRASTAYTLLNINITVTIAVAGFVLSDKADLRLLLILPLTSPALGMLFIDQSLNIRNLGDYIKYTLRPSAIAAAEDNPPERSKLLGWEDFVDKYEQKMLLRVLPHGLPLILLFAAFPFAALVFCATRFQERWEWALWIAGLALVLTYMALWISFIIDPKRQSRRTTIK